MIVVYTGNRPFYSVQMIGFQKGVPSFAPPGLRAEIAELPDFEIYDPEKTYSSVEKQPILIQLPFEFTNFLAAIPTVERIKEYFPLNPLELIYPSEWMGLMNYGQNNQFYNTNKEYYRSYNLTVQNSSHIFNDYEKRLYSLHCLILRFIMMFDIQKDMKSLPPQVHWPKKTPERPYVLIFPKGTTNNLTFPGLGAFLADNFNLDLEIKICNDTKPGNINEQIDLINNATYCIFCGINELAYLAGCLRIPCFAFFMPDNPARLEKQYEIFPDFLWSEIQYHDGVTLFPKIVSRLEALIKPFIPEGGNEYVPESNLEDETSILEPESQPKGKNRLRKSLD